MTECQRTGHMTYEHKFINDSRKACNNGLNAPNYCKSSVHEHLPCVRFAGHKDQNPVWSELSQSETIPLDDCFTKPLAVPPSSNSEEKWEIERLLKKCISGEITELSNLLSWDHMGGEPSGTSGKMSENWATAEDLVRCCRHLFPHTSDEQSR